MPNLSELPVIGRIIQPTETDRDRKGPSYAVEVFDPDLERWVCASEGNELSKADADELAEKIRNHDTGFGDTVKADELRVVPTAESTADLEWWTGSRTPAISKGRAEMV